MIERETEVVAWRLTDWCQKVALSLYLFNQLPPERLPTWQIIGKRKLITESPGDWLARMRRLDGSKGRGD